MAFPNTKILPCEAYQFVVTPTAVATNKRNCALKYFQRFLRKIITTAATNKQPCISIKISKCSKASPNLPGLSNLISPKYSTRTTRHCRLLIDQNSFIIEFRCQQTLRIRKNHVSGQNERVSGILIRLHARVVRREFPFMHLNYKAT